MKRIVIFIILISAVTAYGQKFGIGVRLGEPSGLTFKKYFTKSAIELSIGRTYWYYNNGWYNNHFNDWYIHQNFGYEDWQYWGYKSSVPICIQAHYMIQKNIDKIGKEETDGLRWYYGAGVQFLFNRYDYDYRYKVHGDPSWYYAYGHSVTDSDLGLDGVIGLEYTFKKAPISVFLDMTLFMEVVDDPFFFWLQGGTGIRFNF